MMVLHTDIHLPSALLNKGIFLEVHSCSTFCKKEEHYLTVLSTTQKTPLKGRTPFNGVWENPKQKKSEKIGKNQLKGAMRISLIKEKTGVIPISSLFTSRRLWQADDNKKLARGSFHSDNHKNFF